MAARSAEARHRAACASTSSGKKDYGTLGKQAVRPSASAHRSATVFTCSYRKLHPTILMVKATKNRLSNDLTKSLIERWVG
jgi:hypothetical protein